MKNRFWHSALWLVVMLVSACTAHADEKGFLVGSRENVVLLGDSITADGHYGQIMQDAIDARFPERQIRVLARGLHGDTARGALQRVEADVVQWRPDWVVINFGINDLNQYSREEFLRHYEALINRISRDTTAKIAVVSPIYPDRNEESAKLSSFVAGLSELSQRYKLLYIPVYETAKRLRPTLPAGVKYAPDGIHPNAIGYHILGQTILGAMKFPLERKTVDLPISWRRVAPNDAGARAQQQFVLALPQPVQVRVSDSALPRGATSRALAPITLDGKLDEWDPKTPLLLERPEQRVWGVLSWPRDHFRARVFTSYDDEAWYFGIDVEDSVVRGALNPRNVVDRDCIEVCLDLRPEEERKAKPTINYGNERHVAQLILSPASGEEPQAMVRMGTGDATFLEGTTIASSLSKLGYQIELRVPKTHFLNAVISPGTSIGFDVAVVNVDRNARYLEATSLRWSGSTVSSFSTREFGELQFR